MSLKHLTLPPHSFRLVFLDLQFRRPFQVCPVLKFSNTTLARCTGIVAHHWSWRVVHLGLAIFASAAFILIFFCFPETSHPGSRDIDKYGDAGKSLPKWRPVILNPLTPLAMLRSPIILSVVGSIFD